MGAGPSSPARVLSDRAKLLEATKSTRTIIDIILEYLLRELNIRDLYLMASPAECKKYVLFTAQTLASHFQEFKIAPTMDKKGVIAFRSIRDLTDPSEAERKESFGLCLHIAFFYIRLFQIYGAIAMTLVDDASIMQERGYISLIGDIAKRDETRFRAPPGAAPPPYRAVGPTGVYRPDKPTRSYGGAISNPIVNLRYFIYLNPILFESIRRFTAEGGQTYKLGIDGPWSSILFSTKTPSDSRQSGVFRVNINERKSYDVGVISRVTSSDNFVFTFDTISYGTGTREIRNLNILESGELSYKFIQMLPSNESRMATPQYVPSYEPEGSKTLNELLTNAFTKMTAYVREYIKEKSEDYRDDYTSSRGKDDERREYYFENATGVDEHLKLQRLVNTLTSRKKPLAHCISRALQLLQTAPLGDMPVESSICNTKFLEGRASVPVGSSLDKSVGLSTLANLYYDIIDIATPGITRSSESVKEYIAFMNQMSAVFVGKKLDATSSTKLGDISTASRDRELCASKTEAISVPSDVSKKAYEFVRALYAIQVKHAARCAQILMKLFSIKNVKGVYEIHVHPNLFKNGIPEINKISAETREVLVDYYKNCEGTYLMGAATIAAGVLKKPVASTLVAAAPPVAAPASRPPERIPGSAPRQVR